MRPIYEEGDRRVAVFGTSLFRLLDDAPKPLLRHRPVVSEICVADSGGL